MRVFDRDRDWREAFRDDQYGDQSNGAAFTRDGRLATTSFDGMIRLYQYNLANENPNFRRVGVPVSAPSGRLPRGIAFSPNGKRLAVGYDDVAAVDILDGVTLKGVGGQRPRRDADASWTCKCRVVPRRPDAVRGRLGQRRPRSTSPVRLGPGRPGR